MRCGEASRVELEHRRQPSHSVVFRIFPEYASCSGGTRIKGINLLRQEGHFPLPRIGESEPDSMEAIHVLALAESRTKERPS